MTQSSCMYCMYKVGQLVGPADFLTLFRGAAGLTGDGVFSSSHIDISLPFPAGGLRPPGQGIFS